MKLWKDMSRGWNNKTRGEEGVGDRRAGKEIGVRGGSNLGIQIWRVEGPGCEQRLLSELRILSLVA